MAKKICKYSWRKYLKKTGKPSIMFKLVKIGFTKDKLVLVILKIIANSNQKANLSGNKFRIYEFLINTRIK